MRLLILLFILLSSTTLFSQLNSKDQNFLDSLQEVIDDPSSRRLAVADAYWSAGDLHRTYLLLDEAKQYFNQALKIYTSVQDNWGIGFVYSSLGLTHGLLGEYETSKKYYTKSIEVYEVSNSKADMAYSYIYLGGLNRQFLRFEEAIENYTHAIELSNEVNNFTTEAYGWSGIGFIHQEMCDYPQALKDFGFAQNAFTEANQPVEAGRALQFISYTYALQGNYLKGLEYAEQCLELAEDLDSKVLESMAYEVFATNYKGMQKFDEALEYQLLVLDINQHNSFLGDLGITYNNLAAILFDAKNYKESLKYHLLGLNENVRINDFTGIALSHTNVSTVYFKLENIDSARYYLNLSKKNVQPNQTRLLEIINLLSFEIENYQSNFSTAKKNILDYITLINKGIKVNFPTLSETEKENYIQLSESPLNKFYDFALQNNSQSPELSDEVYNNTLIRKGLLLKSSTLMRQRIMASGDNVLIELYEKWIGLKKDIAVGYSTDADIEDLEVEAEALEKQLVSKSNAFADISNINTITWKDVQSSLKPDEAAIEFINFKHYNKIADETDSVIYCALVVKPNSKHPEMIELCYEFELEAILGKVGGNNKTYIDKIYGASDKLNTALYDLIWKPIETTLSETKKVFISPCGYLHRVSFQALAIGVNSFLCDKYQLYNQSSTSKIVNPELFSLSTVKTVNLFGGINYGGAASDKIIWNYLEGTAVEVDQIKTLLADNKIDFSLFKKENEFKEHAGSGEILHISTHGFFYPDPEVIWASLEVVQTEENIDFRAGSAVGVASFVQNKNPLMRSGLVLEGANRVWNSSDNPEEEDGVLTAYEVAQTDLSKTELVVLSACETGLGDIKGSEGVYGLQRAFKMAGTKFIIMSLWQVPDKETQEFMTLFYKNLIEMKMIKNAFHKTQQSMRIKYDPYYWAAFVLVE